MKLSKAQSDALSYFTERYDIIRDYPLVAEKPIRLSDAAKDAARVCRFCGLSKPQVRFIKVAHAAPEFLGNKALISMNECDVCNEYLADNAEDHLSKWFGPLRTVSQIKGKSGVPTYKTDQIRIEMGQTGLQISVAVEGSGSGIMEGGPFTLNLPVATPSQTFVPLKAAKALVKIACSVSPYGEIPECKPAIDWLMGRAGATFSQFPVLFAFTPGPNPYKVGKVLLLRRKLSKPIPYLWCIVATSNYRFQFFVPFCPSDSWLGKKETQFSCRHFPTPFGEDWEYGETKFGVLNWSSPDPTVVEPIVSFHVDKATKVDMKKEGKPQGDNP